MKTPFLRSFAAFILAFAVVAPYSAFAADAQAPSSFTLYGNPGTLMLSGTSLDTTQILLSIRAFGAAQEYTHVTAAVAPDTTWSAAFVNLPAAVYSLSLFDAVSGGVRLLASGTVTLGNVPPPIAVAPVQAPTGPSTSTLVVSSIPLLTGGVVHASGIVPVSYLQITNVGTATTTLLGFTLRQNGTASTNSIIGFTTVDDQGASRGSTGGFEGSTPFTGNTAVAAANGVFAPGQMKLFTIKAQLSQNVSASFGKTLMLDVTALTSNAATRAAFPITGTTWTIGY